MTPIVCYWSLLYDVAEIIGARGFRFDDQARGTLDAAVRVAQAERGLLFLHDRSRDLAVAAAHGIAEGAGRDPATPSGRAIADLVEEALRTDLPAMTTTAGDAGGPRAALALPLRAIIRDGADGALAKPLGVLYLDRPAARPFTAGDLGSAEAFADHAARAMVLGRLFHAATVDPLTGLYTRPELEQSLSVEMTIATHANAPLGLAMLEIDRFDEIVNARGRHWADETLAAVAGRVRGALGEADMAFRYGGGKLIVLLPGRDEKAAERDTARLCAAASSGGGEVTVSAGVALFPRHADKRGDLVKKADQALFIAASAAPRPSGQRVALWHRGVSKYALRTDKLIGIITGDPARDYRNVLLLLDAIAVVNSIREPQLLLSTILDMMIELTDAERGIVFVPDGAPGSLLGSAVAGDAAATSDMHISSDRLPRDVQGASDRLPRTGDEQPGKRITGETARLLAITDRPRPPPAKPDPARLSIALAQDAGKRPIIDPDYCQGVVEKVARSGLPVSIVDYLDEDDPTVEARVRQLGLRMVICVPLQVQDRLVGVLYVDSRRGAREVVEADLIFFQALAREIGVALENARLYDETVRQRSELEELNRRLARKVRKQAHELEDVKHTLEVELKTKYDYDKIVGKSPRMQEIYRLLDRITDTEVPVLIHGESGTGKELVAKAIHYNGPRKRRRFVSVNCAAIAPSLLESELFGHVKGAFTGADRDKPGLFEQADGGTIFLDEVQDMSAGMQRELLRVLQEKEVRRVGGKDVTPVDVRVISATNRDLKDLMKKALFREDLYYRMNVVAIDLPPLRERKEDIPLLVERYLSELAKLQGRTRIVVERAALRKLLRHEWPGNVRELQNVLERTMLMLDGDTVTEDSVDLEVREAIPGVAPGPIAEPAELAPEFFGMPYKDAAEAFKTEYIRRLLTRHQGNVTRASEQSGLVRSSFHKIMRKLDVSARDARGGAGGGA